MIRWWFSCRKFTIQVNTRDGLIVWTAPYARKFIGQPLGNLERWASTKGNGGLEMVEL